MPLRTAATQSGIAKVADWLPGFYRVKAKIQLGGLTESKIITIELTSSKHCKAVLPALVATCAIANNALSGLIMSKKIASQDHD